MLTPDNSVALVTQFQGSSQAVDNYDVDPAHGLYCQNTDFILGQAESVQAGSRRGTSQVAQIPGFWGGITTLISWFFSYQGTQETLVGCYAPAVGMAFFNQNASAFSEIVINVTGAAIAVCVTDGLRIYVAFADFSGRKGIAQAVVFGLFNGTISVGNEAVDTLFASPLPTTIATIATTQPGSGVITAGFHRVGYIFTTRNGDAAGVLNPVTSGGVFAPISFTAADGTHNLQITITFLSIPQYLSPTIAPVTPTVQIVMTSASNAAEYYLVPGAIGNVPSTPGAVVITFSISDGDLVTGTNVTLNSTLLSAINGAGPFNPSAIWTYSSRMLYATLDSAGFPVVYASDVNDYQSISAANSGIYLEGRQIPVHGCSLGGICYIATVAALYTTQDNGGFPTTWVSPTRVDGSVGILSPTCLLAVGGKILLASEKGLYIYRGGPFPVIPVSYWQAPDWNRINWAQPTQVQIVDDAQDKVIRVQAPLSVVVIAASNTNPIVITTAVMINGSPVANPHLFQAALSVTISGVLGNTAANGTFLVQNNIPTPNSFIINVAGNGAYTGGGVVTPNAPNAQMCWNYAAGDSPGQTFYSLHAFSFFLTGSMGLIRNVNSNLDETWFGPNTTSPGALIRRVNPTDPNVNQDADDGGNGVAINSWYETSNLPGSQDEAVTLHDSIGAHFRISGSGSLNVKAYTLDHALTIIPPASPLTLSQKPGLEYLMKWFARSEQHTIGFGTNLVGNYFIAAVIRFYYSNSLPQR